MSTMTGIAKTKSTTPSATALLRGLRLAAATRLTHATKIARFLIWSGKSAIPNANALGGDMELIDSIHLGGCASGSAAWSRLLRPRTTSRPPTVTLMIRPVVEAALSPPPKRVSPTIPVAAQVVTYPSTRAVALGRGLREPKNRMVRRSRGGAIEPPMARTMSPGSRSLIDILLAMAPATPVSLSQACTQGRGERPATALGFLWQGRLFLLLDACHYRVDLLSPQAAISSRRYSFSHWSGLLDDRSNAISPLRYYSCAKASRSCFSCSSGRLVEMISKSYCFSSSTTLSTAVAPLVSANRAEVPSVTFSRTCLMKSSSMPTSANEPDSPPIAAPRKGTKKIIPIRKPQKAPQPALPPCNSRVLGFLLPWGQLTIAASSKVINSRSCMPCRATMTLSAP